MDHVAVLNKILAHDCPSRGNGNLSEFNIELHCVNVRVIARLTSGDSEDITYDIVKLEITD